MARIDDSDREYLAELGDRAKRSVDEAKRQIANAHRELDRMAEQLDKGLAGKPWTPIGRIEMDFSSAIFEASGDIKREAEFTAYLAAKAKR